MILTLINIIMLCAYAVIVTLQWRRERINREQDLADMWQRAANHHYRRCLDLIRERDTREIEHRQREKQLASAVAAYRDKYKQAHERLKIKERNGKI